MITMLIPSRIDSNRLYGKALMRINGKELLDYVLEACLKAHLIDFVGIITTDRNDDFDIYEKFCSKIFVYRCPEPDYNNVLLRYDLAIREIEKALKAATQEEREHVTLHIKNNPELFKIGEVNAPFIMENRKYSIDTKEELENIKKIIELLEV